MGSAGHEFAIQLIVMHVVFKNWWSEFDCCFQSLFLVQPSFGVTCFAVNSELVIEKATFLVKYLLISKQFLCTCKFVCAVQGQNVELKGVSIFWRAFQALNS